MAVSCASRFAVLKIEDDDYDSDSSDNGGLKQKKLAESKRSSNVPESKNKSKKKKKKTANKESLDLLSLSSPAVEPAKPAATKTAAKSTKRSATNKQWEEWLQKDTEYVSESFEADLQKALLLSKLDYEEKKDIYEAPKVDEELGATAASSNKKKKKNSQQKKQMSLDDFNNSSSSPSSASKDEPPKPQPVISVDFFDQINDTHQEIIVNEKKNKKSKRFEASKTNGLEGATASSDATASFEVEKVRAIEYEERLRDRDQQIECLQQEVFALKEELKECKSRKKRLCKLMFEGEMRDKAALLVQVEQLNKVKDDLTEQFTELHAALEQERSKVHQLQNELKKNQGKRRDERKNSQKES